MRTMILLCSMTCLAAFAFAQTVYDVSLDGAQVPTASSHTGSGTVTLNAAEDEIVVSITHTIPSGDVTNGHIHEGAVGVDGPVSAGLGFSGAGVSPISETLSITPAQVTLLQNEELYVNIHTNAFPSGEIRGQILPQAGTGIPTVPTGAQVETYWPLLAVLMFLIIAAAVYAKRPRTA
jgi:trimeric autotransporter adhesin